VVGSFYGKGLGFLATASVSRLGGPDMYGRFTIVLSLYSVLAIVAGTQLSRAVATYAAQEPHLRRAHYWHGLVLTAFCYVVTLMLFYAVVLVFHPFKDALTARLSLMYMPFLWFFLYTELIKGLHLGAGRVGALTVMEIVQGTLKAGVVVGLVYLLGYRGWIWGRTGGEVLATGVLVLMMLGSYRRYFAGQALRFSKAITRRYASYYGWSFLSGGLGQLELQLQPFLVLWFMNDNSEVAFIKIALLYLTSLSLFGQSVTTALYSSVARRHKDKKGLLRHLWRTQIYTGGGFALALAALWLVAPQLIMILHGPAYTPVVPLFRLILIAAFFQHVNFINGGYWLAVGNVKLNTLASVIMSTVFFSMSIPLCMKYQTLGLAYATVASRIFNAVLSSWLSHRNIVPDSAPELGTVE